MQTPDSQEIISRFFKAISLLKEMKVIGGQAPFCQRYGINRRNLWKLQNDMASDIFQVSWLGYLVRDFGLSAEWLLTGSGEVFSRIPEPAKKSKNRHNLCTAELPV